MARTYSNSEFEDILVYFTHSILGKNTEEEIAWDLAKNCISRLGFEDCVIYFLDETNNLLVQKAAYGPKNPRQFEIANPILIPVGEGITGSVAQQARSELIPDTTADKRYIVDDERRFSEITVPILVDGKVFGVIDCEHREKNFFTPQHLKILEAIASICSIKISKVRAERASKEKEQHLLNIQKELLTLKIEALRTQMNPHFLFNAINSIQYFITIGDKKSSLMFLTTFSKLIRYHLNHFEKDEVSIGDELQLMQWYLDLQEMRYTGKFEYDIQARITDYQSTLKIPAMILGSFTESLLENALLDNETPASVKIEIIYKDNALRLTARYATSKKATRERMVNYRDQMASWEEQIDLLNRLRNLKIEKEKSSRLLKGATYNHRITITLPTIE